jgi:hypothetical protein
MITPRLRRAAAGALSVAAVLAPVSAVGATATAPAGGARVSADPSVEAPEADRCPVVADKMFAAADRRVTTDRITPAPSWRTDCKQLYRADSVAPQLIFEQGFHPGAPVDGQYDLAQRALADQSSPYVVASYDHDLYKDTDRTVYNYYIDAPGGVDVNKTLGDTHQRAAANEVAFPGGISRERVVGACPVDVAKRTEIMAECQDNPHYQPWRG